MAANRTTTPRTATAAMKPILAMIGRPRSRRMGRWPDRRVAVGARLVGLAGAGRPVDAGRGLTCVCRGSRRVVIRGIVARGPRDGLASGPGRRATSGPQPGYIGVRFVHGIEEINLWFTVTDGESARALGLHGADLFTKLQK